MAKYCKIVFFFFSFVWSNNFSFSQVRSYVSNSVLQTGNFFKIATYREGIYKIDIPLLSGAGINTSNISSHAIQLFGIDNRLLQEDNAVIPTDDLVEIPILLNDGGDGIFNGNDFFVFYAQGSTYWQKDSLGQRFTHVTNLYNDSIFFFLKLNGSTGKRITTTPSPLTFNQTATSFNERFVQETDLVNFLKSGKEWYGQEFSNILGNNLTRNFTVNWQGLQANSPVWLHTNLVSRSIGSSSSFAVSLNNSLVQTHNISAVNGGYLDVFAFASSQQSQQFINSSTINIQFNYNASTSTSQGWLNWFTLNGRRSLDFSLQSPLFFRDWASVAAANNTQFIINNASANTLVWDITEPLHPKNIVTNLSGGNLQFIASTPFLKEFVAFTTANTLTPIFCGAVANQNLHNHIFANGIIITHPSLFSAAQQLAMLHLQQLNSTTLIATTHQIYNEFSAGVPTPIAIRNYIKMLWDKAPTNQKPSYVVLLGTGSYDYKNRVNGNVNLIPTYQSPNSLNPLITHTSDDFFGFLDNTDDVNNNTTPSTLDVAIGRIPCKNVQEANTYITKLKNYYSNSSFGNWRNNAIFFADDKDFNLHLQDAELMANTSTTSNPNLLPQKVYIDAYPRVASSGGATYPQANTALVNNLLNGALFLNYSGHGSSQRLTEEAVFSFSEINKLQNKNKLPVFVTATCDFAPHDNPTENSLGHQLLFNSQNGAVALVTTTRVVFAYSNKIINTNYLQAALQKNSLGNYLSLGQGFLQAKNTTYTTFGDVPNNRKFTLLGDPALQLAFPKHNIQFTQLNNKPFTPSDTLKPLYSYQLNGNVVDNNLQPIANFNGTVELSILNAPKAVSTLANDPQSFATNFNVQNSVVFKGSTTATNGNFSFKFIVPKDIGALTGIGKISAYANTSQADATNFTNILVGGNENTSLIDKEGPFIKPFLNDEKFVNGGLVNEDNILIIKFADSSGINATGSSIGHDITLVIDGDEKNTIILNSFYQSLLGRFTQGELRYALPNLAVGQHTLKIKAWDVANNSSTVELLFVVAAKESLVIKQVYNYPNPFSQSTNFWFEHNLPNTDISVLINIYTVSGKLVKQIRKTVNTVGNRVNDIFWDGKDESNEKLAKGVYFYTIIATSGNGRAQTTQKLYLL